jgi:cyclic pyranopterin phosphate synthase
MVDVSPKAMTRRVAVAEGSVLAKHSTLDLIRENGLKKGDVITTAHLAGVMGAKRTADLIPLCHPIALDAISLEFEILEDRILVRASTTSTTKTGVEMEALTAVTVACLTIYDMCKAVDREMTLTQIRLMEKSGGKSGPYKRVHQED